MKIELIKETKKFTGEIEYFIRVNDKYTIMKRNLQDAEAEFNKTLENAKLYPEDKYETIRSVEYIPGESVFDATILPEEKRELCQKITTLKDQI